MPIEIIELLVFWFSFLLNIEVISFHGMGCETDEVGEAFAHNGGGQSEVLWQRPLQWFGLKEGLQIFRVFNEKIFSSKST